ncbi:MAG: hypothetical protein K6T83_22835 [Alicyclobacillus sp.]|nr:hypothetical protein [Alicyclobacillus sp.]
MRRVSLRKSWPFIISVAAISLPLSAAFDTSTVFLNEIPWYFGAAIVVLIVFLGALFDMVGVAAAAAAETPFHAMAAKKLFGARRAVQIIRNAEKVSSICSDVVGDIAGVLSGAGALAVSVQLADTFGTEGWIRELLTILVTAMVTALTVACKAMGKTLAIHAPTPIILTASRGMDILLMLFGKRQPRRAPARRSRSGASDTKPDRV